MAMSCVQEKFEMDPDKVPSASELEVKIDVDQATNYVTFSIENQGMVPMWLFGEEMIDGKANKKYAYTGNGLQLRLRDAGTHSVEVKAYNAHGVSVGSKVVEFTLENTYRDPFDPSKYKTMLAGSESKTWEWNSTEKGHFGCGSSAATPDEWWSANANDKDGMGLYDDRMTFSADGKYTYNPGEGGTVYVNTGSGYGAEYNTNDGQDYQVPIEAFTVDYSFENAWNDAGIEEVYLVLAEGANLSYIPNQAALDEPRYLIIEQTTKKITLAHSTPDISWKYQFIVEGSAEPEKPNTGEVVFDPNSDRNMWKNAVTTDHHFYFADEGWGAIENATVTSDGGTHTFVLPQGLGSQQWQGQFFFQNTGLATSAAKTYDFYLVMNSTADHPGVTVKLCAQDDDGAIITDGRYALTAYEDYVLKVVAAPGIDCENLKLVLDFGGGQGGSSVVVKDIILQEHIGGAPAGPAPFDPSAADNLWNGANTSEMTYYYAPGWAQIDNPGFVADGNNYTITLPEATTDQWQAQVAFANTGIAVTPDKNYDFHVVLTSTQDHPGVTIKLTQNDDDNVFFFADRHALTAYEDYVYEVVAMPGIDASNLKLVLDFGGNVAGTEVVVKDVVLRESQSTPAPEPEQPEPLDPNSDANLWKTANTSNVSYWFANNDWGQIANPEYTAGDNEYTLIMPEGIGALQWQGQFVFNNTGIVTTPDKTYDFQVTLYSEADHPHVTVKPCYEQAPQNDVNELFVKSDIALTAYEEYVYTVTGLAGTDIPDLKMVFDFGGAVSGSKVVISGITLIEH